MNKNSAVVLEILKLCFVMLTVPLQLLNIAFSICGIYPDLMHSSVYTKSTCGSCGQSWCMISSVSYYLIGQRFWLWCLPRGPGCPWTHSVDQHHWSWHSHCSPQICIILSVITFCYTPGHLAHIFLFFLVCYVLIQLWDLDSHDRLPVQQSHLVGNSIVPSFCTFSIVLSLW